MAKLIECDFCGEQIPESDFSRLGGISEAENIVDFCCSDCQSSWHDENDCDSDNNELIEVEK